ncbi:hypothetical protein GYB22_01300 [bacterium]|nr:hypothetical protein [bacterium]
MHQIRIKLLFIIVLSGLVFTACNPYTYRYKSVAHNPYLFTEKGDWEVDLHTSALGGVQAAYAISDNIGVSAGYVSNTDTDTSMMFDSMQEVISSVRYRNRQSEINLAFLNFGTIGEGSWSYELQTGLAFDRRNAKSEILLNRNNDNLNVQPNESYALYNRYFFQPAIGRTGRVFDFMFSTRFQLIHYLDLRRAYPTGQYRNYTDFVAEPVITLRAGFPYCKLMFQFGIRLFSESGPYNYLPGHLGVGLAVPVTARTKPKS